MSLINKMLQDLDARGSQAGSALQSEIKPVMIAERRLPLMQIVLGVTVVVIAMAIAAYFWLKGRAPGPVSNAPAVLTAAAPAETVPVAVTAKQIPYVPPEQRSTAAVAAPATAPVQSVTPLAAPPVQPVTPLASPPLQPVTPFVAPAAQPATPIAKPPVAMPARVPAAAEPVKAPASAPKAAMAVAAAPAVEKLSPVAPRALPAPRELDVAVVPEVQRTPAPVQAGVGRDMTAAQRAESQYRSAMASLEAGRVSSALEGLEAALKLNPRHDAARQSLVALLIEAGRNDEAMQQLEQGLAVDAAQPALAMLLARMQIERGTSGVGTLQRTLPAAQGNADYHAFLGGALQRENRHREAVEQYQAALRRIPDQGVWLMGLGISLQAEKREADALAAFQKAKMSGMLTPALMTFVQGKIQQLQ